MSKIQVRRGTQAEWAAANPTLAAGEPAFETDTALAKIGDGVSDWGSLIYLGNDLVQPAPATSWPLDIGATGAKLITSFQSGHGFTFSGADASSNLNDTTAGLPVWGSQCVTLVSAGAGASAIVQRTNVTSFDYSSSVVMLLVRVEDMTHLSSLHVDLGSGGGFSNHMDVNVGNAGVVSVDTWVWVAASPVDAVVTGSPDRTAFNSVRVYIKDDNTGAKCTVHLQAIAIVPNAGARAGQPYPNGVACITFDDAHFSQYSVAKPYMDSLGLRGTAFIIGERIGVDASSLTLAQVKDMQDRSGWCISTHTWSSTLHSDRLTDHTPAEVATDMSTMRAWLLKHGLRGRGLAYPGGSNDQPTIEALRPFQQYGRSTAQLTASYPPPDLYRIPCWSNLGGLGGTSASSITATTTGKIDKAVAEKAWLNLAFHHLVPDILSVTMSGNIATVTFASQHPFGNGVSLTFAGFTPAGLNGTHTTLSGLGTSQLTVNIGSNPGNGTIMGSILGASTDCSYTDFKAICDKLVSSGIAIRTMDEVINRLATAPPAFAALTSSQVPIPDSTIPAIGSATTAAHSDHAHQRERWTPADQGFVTWTYDPISASGTYVLPTAGLVMLARVHNPVARDISNIVMTLTTVGSSLTTGQCWAAVYRCDTGALLGQTADQASNWTTGTGTKTMALTGAPIAAPAGDLWIAVVFNGSTGPTFSRCGGQAAINAGLTGATSRYSSADASVTTTMPPTITASRTSVSTSWWAALS